MSSQKILFTLLFGFTLQSVWGMSTVQDISKGRQSQRSTTFPNSIPACSSDIETLVRQTGQLNPSKAAIGIPSTCACQHGFPQAFAMDPLHAGRMNSGLLKLTCPHLVRAVDNLEDQGMILDLNRKLLEENNDHRTTSGATLKSAMVQTHKKHSVARKSMLSEEDLIQIKSKIGEPGLQAFLEAGVAGSSIDSLDTKCLHAWLADALFDGPTPLGDAILEELQNQFIDVSGTPTCYTNCDPTYNPEMANPPKPRNKQRLRTTKESERRRRRRQEQQQ